jgi:tRNA(Ile2) C34 agmatinyltransferase TiaS
MECPNCGLAMDEVFRKGWVKKFRCRGCGTVDTSRTLWLSEKELMPFSKFYYEVLLKESNNKPVQMCTNLTVKCPC